MTKIVVIAIGKDKDQWVTAGIEHYTKLLKKYARLELIALPSPKKSATLSPSEIKSAEADLLKKKIPEGYLIALSDSGRGYDSHQFADRLRKIQNLGRSPIVFIIGGPYGLDNTLISQADECLSLSPLTFSHQVVRLVLLEQLFRGFSILHNSDYHK